MINFAHTWNNLLEHCISVDFLLMDGYAQRDLRKGLLIDTFVERFKTAYLGKFLMIKVVTDWNNSPKHCIFDNFLPIVGYIQAVYERSCSLLLS